MTACAGGSFFFDHSNIVYRYSTDGITWSDKASTDSGGLASAHFDMAIRDMTVALCWGADVPQNVPIYFKKGTISGGTISWDETVDTGGRGRYLECTAVAIDTNDNYYVAFNGQNNYMPMVLRSADGMTWNLVFQGDRSNGGYCYFAFILSPLSDGKMLFLFPYHDYNYRIDYAYFDGSRWSSQQQVYKGIESGRKYDVISACGNDADTVHIIRLDDSGHVQYCTYTFPDIWSDDTAIETEHTDKCPNIGMTENIYVFYIYNDIIHMRRRSGVWEDEATPFGRSFASPAYVIAEMRSPSPMIGVAWREGARNPYTINFGLLSEAVCHCNVSPV